MLKLRLHFLKFSTAACFRHISCVCSIFHVFLKGLEEGQCRPSWMRGRLPGAELKSQQTGHLRSTWQREADILLGVSHLGAVRPVLNTLYVTALPVFAAENPQSWLTSWIPAFCSWITGSSLQLCSPRSSACENPTHAVKGCQLSEKDHPPHPDHFSMVSSQSHPEISKLLLGLIFYFWSLKHALMSWFNLNWKFITMP